MERRMTARVLDATKTRDQVFAELKDEIGRLATEGIRPGHAAVLVGEILPPSPYVKNKIAACN
jgi:5,10-methylene-tetrahydrofolate dehydrogenase/methenyl tetrahydrofolate cyclohydrolase